MSIEMQKRKIYIVVPYFGKLPTYIDLWLHSCGKNLDFNWLLLTDDDCGELDVPSNVVVLKSSLSEIKTTLSKAIGFEVALSSPYKLCDFRPIYWALLDDLGIVYDFWGHCDLDMIFGQLSKFITTELLDTYDKIFTLGHLTLYRNSPIAKLAFMLSSSAPNWRDVFTNSQHVGFDEHIGVNLAWEEWGLLQYENEKIVVDIDPAYTRFELTKQELNRPNQLFFYDDGKVLQGFYKAKKWQTFEYAYIHFQKRKMPKNDLPFDALRFYIGPSGFQRMQDYPPTVKSINALTGPTEEETYIYMFVRLRSKLRYAVRRFFKFRGRFCGYK